MIIMFGKALWVSVFNKISQVFTYEEEKSIDAYPGNLDWSISKNEVKQQSRIDGIASLYCRLQKLEYN